jgi:hypothetical protein
LGGRQTVQAYVWTEWQRSMALKRGASGEADEVRSSRRDGWLRLDDGALLRDCWEERYRASGPGGQRRNKVETAVRLHHRPSGIVAHSEESRFKEENRKRALRRLRERMAVELRVPFDLETPPLAPEFVAQRGPKGSLSVNQRNRAYPIIVAAALDALKAADGSYAMAARALGLTTSQLLRFLRSDPQMWRAVRQAQGRADG